MYIVCYNKFDKLTLSDFSHPKDAIFLRFFRDHELPVDVTKK